MKRPAKMLVREHSGVSPHTFDAVDENGKRHSVWFLDHEELRRILADGPCLMSVEDWQLHGGSKDLAEVALTTGIHQ